MEISVAQQTWMFLASVALGAVLGICYDVFRILRIALKHPTIAVLIEDILFFAVCAVATFCFLLAAGDGQLRAFILIGELIGAILYYCTIGVLVIGISKRMIAAIKWVLHSIWKILIQPIYNLISKIISFIYKKMEKTANGIKGKMKNSNLHLQTKGHLLYNLKSSIMQKKRKNVCSRPKKRSVKNEKG